LTYLSASDQLRDPVDIFGVTLAVTFVPIIDLIMHLKQFFYLQTRSINFTSKARRAFSKMSKGKGSAEFSAASSMTRRRIMLSTVFGKLTMVFVTQIFS
jgi:hypothetical protein